MARTVAVVDIGSTSIQLTIADVCSDHITIRRKEKRIARLADELDESGRLSTYAFNEVENALRHFQTIAETANVPLSVTGTATLRAAKNREQLLERVRSQLGLSIKLLSGGDEARLVLAGVLFGHPDLAQERLLAVDVGGGSSELITGINGKGATIASVPIGSLVVHQKWLGFEQPNWSNVRQARRCLRSRFSNAVHLSRAVTIDTLVGTGGTIQRLVRLARNRVLDSDEIDGAWLSQDDINDCIEKLMRAKTGDGRRALAGIDPDRADFILGGALVYAVVMESFQANGWRVSTSALRTGMLTSPS